MAAGKPPAARARKTTARKAPAKKATPPAKKQAAKKAAPAKRAARAAAQPTAEDRAAAAAQLGNVTPIRGARAARAGHAPAGTNSATTPAALRLHERREKALNYRRLGLQWAQVAQRIRQEYPNDVPRYSHADAYNDAKALIDSVTVEAVQGVREEDLAMLMALQRRIFPRALDGDLKAADRMMRILDQRAKYLGLYAPHQVELAGAGGGPIELAAADPRVVYNAALDALDAALPHVPPPELPGAPG